jgi:hypothetical protein
MDFHPYFNQTDKRVSPAGSHATTSSKELVAGVSGKKNAVHALTLSTLVNTPCIVQLTNGSGGNVLYEVELQSSIVPGVVLPIDQVAYCETSAGNALHLKLSNAQKVTYSLMVVQGD